MAYKEPLDVAYIKSVYVVCKSKEALRWYHATSKIIEFNIIKHH